MSCFLHDTHEQVVYMLSSIALNTIAFQPNHQSAGAISRGVIERCIQFRIMTAGDHSHRSAAEQLYLGWLG